MLVIPLILAGPLLIGSGCADTLLLSANHRQINTTGLGRQLVHVEGRDVECWIARSPGAAESEPQAFVLFFVGKGDRADRWIRIVADAWGNKPVEVWGMNYPGSGGSEGPADLSRVEPDAVAVYDKLRAEAPNRPVFVHASSFGTAVALSLAARRPVAGLVLHNPAPLRQLILGRYGWWNLWLVAVPVALQIPDDLDSVDNAAHCTAPVVFIQSGNDEVIPASYQALVINAYEGPKAQILEGGAGHSAPLSRQGSKQLRAWMSQRWDQVVPLTTTRR
jgi:pimeloyl-ACP methyl ester carboxylesterase